MPREEWKVTTDRWVYRNPFHQAGVWRCRRRNVVTGAVESFIVRDPKTLKNARTQKHAQRLVATLANADAEAATSIGANAARDKSLADAITEYLAGREVSPGTLEDYTLCLRNVVLPALENAGLLTVREVKYEHVAALFTTTAKERKWTARNRQKYLFVLRSFFKECVKRGYTETNPGALYDLPKNVSRAVRQSRDRGIALTEDQARKLLKHCKDPFVAKSESGIEFRRVCPPDYLHLAVMIALRTGLRRGNVLGLRVEHLKNDLTEIDIPATEMKNRERLRIPVHPELQPLLETALKQIRKREGRSPTGQDHLLGDIESLRHTFDRAVKRAGLEHVDGRRFRFHDLRHTFSTWLSTRVSEAVKDALMGHAPTTISRRYVHIGVNELRAEIDKLPWLGPREADQEATKAN